jgi:5-methylcytosine-specific restriction enzyme A
MRLFPLMVYHLNGWSGTSFRGNKKRIDQMAMLKLCRCGKQIPIQLARCEPCQEKYEVEQTERKKERQKKYDKDYDRFKRDPKSTAFYKSREWKQVRLSALRRDKWMCRHCLKDKKAKPAAVVDHIIPIKVNWSLRLSLDNMQALCHKCHNLKTLKDTEKY